MVDNTKQLLSRLESAVGAREQFVGNAVHRILAPFAGVNLNAQPAGDENTSKDVDGALAEMCRAVDRRGHGNAHLRGLARAEAALGRGLRRSTIDRVKRVRGGLDDLSVRALERNVRSHLEMPGDPVVILGEVGLLTRMRANLIAHGIVYGRLGGNVWVSIEAQPHAVALIVEDDGPGNASIPDVLLL